MRNVKESHWRICQGAWHNSGFLGGSDDNESVSNAGDLSSIPGLARSPEEENSYPLQYPLGGKELDTTEQLTLSLFTWHNPIYI